MPHRRTNLPSIPLSRSFFPLLVTGLLLFWTAPVHSAEIVLAGPAATWQNLAIITNSVCSAVTLSELDHTVASTSEVDTCLSFLPDLIPAVFGPLAATQTIPNWSQVGVWLAGSQTALTELRLRWCVDGNVMLVL